MIAKILIGLVVLVVALTVLVALQPSTFRVARSTRISAPPDVVFSYVNDFHEWEAWSPWAKLDPHMKETYSGPQEGVGATYAWVGDSNVGEGRMTIVESRPGEFLQLRLEFLKPFKGNNTAEFTFKPDGDGTQVTWTMFGEQHFISKAIGLVMNMDKMIGKNFEEGLSEMKALSEKKTLL